MAVASKKQPREQTLDSLEQAQLWIETLDARTLPRDPFVRHLYKEVKNHISTVIDAQREMIDRQRS